MPLYEYRCARCGRLTELLQRVGASGAGVPCPDCGEAALERALSTFATACAEATPGGACPTGRFT